MLSDLQAELVLELLWRATWQSFALASIVVAIMLTARQHIAPRWRVVLWTLPLCRLTLLVLPTSSFSLFSLVETPFGTTEQFTSASPPLQSSIVHSPAHEVPIPEPKNHLGLDARQINPISSVDIREQKTAATGTTAGARNAGTMNALSKTLLWLWIAGCLICLVRYFLTRIELASILARATPLDRDPITQRISSQRLHYGIRRRIKCLVVDREIGPASTGLISPTILIPQSLLSELNERQLVAIVDHELHHIRRFDSAYLLLSQAACWLHWYNPLAYWVSARLRSEIEHAVDAATVGQVDDETKKVYGDLLIHLACRRSRSLGLAPMADRKSNLRRRIDELLAPARNSKLRSGCCVVAILILVMTGLSEVASTQVTIKPGTSTQDKTPSPTSVASGSKPATENESNADSAEQREFELLIVGTDGKAIPEAEVDIRGRPNVIADWIVEGEFIKQGTYGALVKPNKEGRIKLLLPPKSSYTFGIKADGYGPYHAEWNRTELPEKFTAELEVARTVGGVVVDEQGQPISDAQVRPNIYFKRRPGDTSTLGVGTRIKTDDQGRWSYAHLSRSLSSFSIEINHPQFMPQVATLSADTFELQPGQQASQTTTMNKGLSVRGKITDATGNPIKGALIRTKLRNDIRSATTNEQGVYELSGCQAGVTRIVASAPGLAVDLKQVQIAEKMDSVDFTMQPGGHVRIRVVNEKGEKVPKARIFFQRWREGFAYFEFEHVDEYADENGIWEWNEAPLDEFKADICRPGGMGLGEQPLIARAEEYVFACPPTLVVVGRVIDAETKQPIESFQVVPGVRSNPQHMNWVPNQIFEAKNGAFEYRETHDYFAHLFKIQSRGYLPVESRDIKSNEGRVEVTFELKRGAGIDMRVMTPDGLPAEGAKVALGIPGAQINVENGEIDDGSTYAQRTVVNAAGRLRFPGQSTAYQLVITHDSGFAHFKSEEAERDDLIRLTPWASAEGTFRVAKKPVGGVQLYLNSGSVHSYGNDAPSIFTSSETTTKQDGSFAFGRVFPGSGRVARSILRIVNEGAKEVTSSTSLAAEFVSKQTTRFEFGLTGCPVVGKLVKPESYNERVLWSFADIDIEPQLGPGPLPIPAELKDQPGKAQDWYSTWKETESGKIWLAATQEAEKSKRAAPRYSASCDTEGNFRIDDMPAGRYTLEVRFFESPQAGQLQNYLFTVPEPNAKEGKTFDLGDLLLKSNPSE